jgi:hypothetical protein
MIYFTTFILALFFTHIARALPQGCNDPTPDLYANDPTPDMYDDNGQFNLPVPPPLHATHDKKYDNPHGDTKHVTCADGKNGLAKKYPKFDDFPHYPFIGGVHDLKPHSDGCGACWKLTNKKTNESISFIAIDHAAKGFTLSGKAYKKLGGGHHTGKEGVEVVGHKVPHSVCGF